MSLDVVNRISMDSVLHPSLHQTPQWMLDIAKAVECLSLTEAKDIILLLIPQASSVYTRTNSIIAKSKTIQYEITALNMRHIWSEDNCTDSIRVDVHINNQKLISHTFELKNVNSIDEIVSCCQLF